MNKIKIILLILGIAIGTNSCLVAAAAAGGVAGGYYCATSTKC